MKNLNLILLILLFASNIQAQCLNGNAEQGNFNNWGTQSGTFPTPVNQMVSPNVHINGVNLISIPFAGDGMTSAGNTDRIGNFPVPNEGVYAFRIGNNSTGGETDAMYYKFTVTNANKNFKFRYAVVLEDPGHPPANQPYFTFFMNASSQAPGSPNFVPHLPTTQSPDQTLFNNTLTKIIADVTNPFFKVNNAIAYKQWQCVEYDLSAYLGLEVLIYFKTADCSQGGHFGYAYVDGLCDALPAVSNFTLNVNTFCDNGTDLILNGIASTGEDRYQISVSEVATWNFWTGAITYSANKSAWAYGSTLGIVNLKQWYETQGGIWNCNKLYVVSITVANGCSAPSSTSQAFSYTCPNINAGADVSICCNRLLGVSIGSAATAGLTYGWNATPTGFTSTSANVMVFPEVTTIYKLTVKDQNGCKATDDITVEVQNDIKVSVNYVIPDFSILGIGNCQNNNPRNTLPYCIGYLEADAGPLNCKNNALTTENIRQQQSRYSYLWSTGETTQKIVPINGISSYTVKVSNRCHNVTGSIQNVIPNRYYDQPISGITAPSGFTPTLTTNSVFKIYETGSTAPAFGTGPAYHAYRYRLRIYNRSGNLIRCIEEVAINPNTGFYNGQIQWDGRSENGTLQPADDYVVQLTFWNCKTDGSGTTNFTINQGRRTICTKYRFAILPPFRKCVEYGYEDVINNAIGFPVTLVR